MDVEFKIREVEEKFRIILKYDIKVNEEKYDKMKSLSDWW